MGVKVDGHSKLERDESSHAIVNTDMEQYRLAKKRKEVFHNQKNEINTLKEEVSEIKGLPVPALLTVFGEYFFTTLKDKYPVFVEKPNLFSFLNSIDQYIHPEVLKLYPDAELPRFQSEIKSDNEMVLNYMSSRKMSDLAIGLIKGAANYFEEDVDVVKIGKENDGQTVMLKVNKI